MTKKQTIHLSCSQHFGEQLAKIREANGLTIQQICNVTGKHFSTVYKFENNAKGWKVGRHNTYLYYCRALGRLLDWEDMEIVLTDFYNSSEVLPEKVGDK